MKRKKESEKEKPFFSFSVNNGNEIEKAKKVKFSSEILRRGFEKILGTTDKMLKEDVKDYSEVGVKKSGNLKIEHGFRIRFLDEVKQNSSVPSTPKKRHKANNEFKKEKKKKQ